MSSLGSTGLTTILVAAAGLATPALGQSSTYDVSKHLDVQVTVAPIDVEVDWTRKLRAIAMVGRLCRDASGLNLTPTVPNVASGVVLTHTEIADAGQNNLCTASAQALAAWNRLSPTSFTMDVRSLGSANPASDMCIGNRQRPARASSRGKSVLRMTMDGVSAGTAGVKGFSAAWVNSQNTLQGFKQRAKLLKDPVVASLYDDLSGALLGQWEVISINSRVFGNGQTQMFDDVGLRIANNAANMELRIEIGSAIVHPLDTGVIHVKVENGVVTQRTLSGRFASVTGIPALNSTAGEAWLANINMSGIDYNMQVPQGMQTRVVFDIGSSSLSSSEAGLVAPVCSLVSNLDEGPGGADLSIVAPGGSTLGYSCRRTDRSVLEDITTTTDIQPDVLIVPFWIDGAAAGTAPTDVFVRFYNGNPASGGTLIYGSTSVTQDFSVNFTDSYRVLASDKTNSTRAINEAVIDVSAAPVIPANTNLWIEVSMDMPGAAAIRIPSSPYSTSTDNSMSYRFTTGVYALLSDIPSGQRACIPFELLGLPPQGCVGDFDLDDDTDSDDIIGFFSAWESGDDSSDADLDGDTDSDDVIVFFTSWEVGC